MKMRQTERRDTGRARAVHSATVRVILFVEVDGRTDSHPVAIRSPGGRERTEGKERVNAVIAHSLTKARKKRDKINEDIL